MSTRKTAYAIANYLEKKGLDAPVQSASQSNSHYITAGLPSEYHDALEKNGFNFQKNKKIRISDHKNPSSHSDYSIRTDADEHKNYGWRTLANQILDNFNPELSFISKLPKKIKPQTKPQQSVLPLIGSMVKHPNYGEGEVVQHFPQGPSVRFSDGEKIIDPIYLQPIAKKRGGIIGLAHSIRPVARIKKA